MKNTVVVGSLAFSKYSSGALAFAEFRSVRHSVCHSDSPGSAECLSDFVITTNSSLLIPKQVHTKNILFILFIYFTSFVSFVPLLRDYGAHMFESGLCPCGARKIISIVSKQTNLPTNS